MGKNSTKSDNKWSECDGKYHKLKFGKSSLIKKSHHYPVGTCDIDLDVTKISFDFRKNNLPDGMYYLNDITPLTCVLKDGKYEVEQSRDGAVIWSGQV